MSSIIRSSGDLKSHNERKKKKQSIETDPEVTQMTELVDTDIMTVIITIFSMCTNIEESLGILSRYKKTQIKFLEGEKKYTVGAERYSR